MVVQLRLLSESAHPSLFIEIEGSIGRRKRNRGYCRCSPMGAVEVQEVVEVDVSQAIAVGEKELLAQTFAHLHDSTTRVGVLARIDNLDVPAARQGLREFPYQLGLVTGGQDEVGEALVGIDLHHVSENRTVSDQQ
jgi:hypothetical protein